MQLQNNNTKKIAIYAVLIAMAMIFSYLESLVPYPIPGAKLGLSNVVVIVALYKLSDRDGLVINLIRILLVGITFGNTFSLLYSLAGGLLSFIAMCFMKNTEKISTVWVSVAGGIMHNVGQILVAIYILKSSAVLSYLPFLWVTGIMAGVIVGILGSIIIKRLERINIE